MAWHGSAWLLLSFSPFPARHPALGHGRCCLRATWGVWFQNLGGPAWKVKQKDTARADSFWQCRPLNVVVANNSPAIPEKPIVNPASNLASYPISFVEQRMGGGSDRCSQMQREITRAAHSERLMMLLLASFPLSTQCLTLIDPWMCGDLVRRRGDVFTTVILQ